MNNTLTDTRPVIFHLITGFDVGGAERMLSRVLPRLTNYQHVVISLTSDGPMRPEYEKLGLTTSILGYNHVWYINAFFRWIRLVRKYQPAILTTYLIHADLVGRIWGKVTGIPIIISSLRARFRGQNHRPLLRLLRQFDGWVDAYLPNSQEVRRYYVDDLHFPAEKFTVITNGLEKSDWPPTITPSVRASLMNSLMMPQTVRVIGTVSQLRPEKGVDRLIDAMARVSDRQIHCLVIGDGIERTRLEAQAIKLGVSQRVHFLGNRSDVAEMLQLMEIFILPSWFEGMSNALLEAMAAGRAIIVTDTPENREVITPDCGRLINTDDPHTVAQAIDALLQSPDDRERLGDAARRRFEQYFSLDEKIEQLNSFYANLLGTT